jgi:hypothetical protein
MTVKLKYLGYSPHSPTPYTYYIETANGKVDIIFEDVYTKETEIEMPDELWGEHSGWADVQCDCCDYVYRERSYPGGLTTCPICDTTFMIPIDAVLEESNL